MIYTLFLSTSDNRHCLDQGGPPQDYGSIVAREVIFGGPQVLT